MKNIYILHINIYIYLLFMTSVTVDVVCVCVWGGGGGGIASSNVCSDSNSILRMYEIIEISVPVIIIII